jgi:hypothetical protein
MTNGLKPVPSPHGDLRAWFCAFTDNIVVLNRAEYFLESVGWWKKMALPRCGHCRLWMTRACPSERQVGGHSEGPSMNGAICKSYAEDDSPQELRQLAAASIAAHDAVLAGHEFSRWPRPKEKSA